MILVGTAGFKFDDWKGRFYPSALAEKNMLAYYANVFSALELDYSYYSMPFPGTLDAMAKKVPPHFVFSIKAHKSMTHEISTDASQVRAAWNQFTEAIHPLALQGKFGCILAQFPNKFRNTRANQLYLESLPDLANGAPLVVEFRNRDWISDDTFSLLSSLGIGYCAVDEPELDTLVPRVALATSRIGYVRLHGRNKSKWYNHENASERYDYLYSESEMQEWATKIRKLHETADKVLVMFNNCHEGKAAQNARDMLALLDLPRVIQGELF